MEPGSWPPPRSIHAAIIRSLHRHGVSTVVMDVWFEGHRVPADDDELARAMAESGNVVLVQRVDRPRMPSAGVSTELLKSPIAQFQQSAISLAPFPLPRTLVDAGLLALLRHARRRRRDAAFRGAADSCAALSSTACCLCLRQAGVKLRRRAQPRHLVEESLQLTESLRQGLARDPVPRTRAGVLDRAARQQLNARCSPQW